MQRFIVGTGRCGSTLVSRMLACHPAVTSLFEFFNGMDAARRLAPEPISGEEAAGLVAAEQPFVTAVLRRGYEVPEIVYPFEEGRRQRGDALPWILVSLLPRLTDDPDALFEAVLAFLAARPPAPAREHHLALFDWLAERSGRPIWIERSGSSIEYLADLVDAYPEARFLHLHRDGPETALSMREHHAYRLPISILYAAPIDPGARLSELPPIDLRAEPRPDDTISRILRSRPPAAYFGRYWCDQIRRGLDARPRVADGHWLELRFEELVARPAESMQRVAEFFALPEAPGFAARAASLVRGLPPSRLSGLSDEERSALRTACAEGQRLLGRL